MTNKKQTKENNIIGYLRGTDLQPRETIWVRPDGTKFIAPAGEDHSKTGIED